ncbi:MAG: hydantoinase/oxoprolinase family protein [Mycolicibacterium hassiacum]|uniref:hydantoinase/oxoprolinase family protein n=1 Tax=Mycolicibacterium hassiacum TaxID=46351 RepID=UPI0023F9B874|nr:hydantoinase/oxoprolinase family protein [Mycolicibacterium hassiacum]MBX5485428.1 hydantoinase/oxoprolinase family protein [Mycolicibacterium hassiacum]
MSEVFAVDVGGTFTDIVVLDTDTGTTRIEKTPTVPSAPATGVVNAVRKAAVDVAHSPTFFHGTTIGLNALLERKGSKVGLLTTQGFRDALELARMNWPMYRLHWQKPDALVPRHLRREIPERVAADGTVLEPLDEAAVLREVAVLLDEGVDAIAVCFLHAYAHPAHEQRAGELIAERWPDLPVTLSHVVTREYREYERTSTAVADAMIRPTVAGYLGRLQSSVAAEGFEGNLFITRCDGGVMGADEARRRSIRTLLSGPASGVMGVAALGRWLGVRNMIAIDMGGTSFDAALVVDGQPVIRAGTEIDGSPLLMPVVELTTIGAGGGSIAWIDAGGALNVGPQSAGAQPGPVCYGNGGTQPTFTDAALVTGLLDPEFFLGGEIALDVAAAAEAIRTTIAEPLGLSVEAAASGIVELTEAKMAATLEEITIGKGYDPREFTLVAYGGGGPLVASALAQRLEIPTTIVPVAPSAFSAWGMLTLDVVHDWALTRVTSLETLDPAQLAGTLRGLAADAAAGLERENIPRERAQLHPFLDLRYEGQEHTLTIPFDPSGGDVDFAALRRAFDEQHVRTYGYATEVPVEVVAYRVRAVGELPKPSRREIARADGDAARAAKGSRGVTHRGSAGSLAFTVYDRALLGAGDVIDGPAIVEEPSATTIVAPTQTLRVDELGNLLIEAHA